MSEPEGSSSRVSQESAQHNVDDPGPQQAARAASDMTGFRPYFRP